MTPEENAFLSTLCGRVSVANDAEMTIPREGLVWQLVWGRPERVKHQAASVIESYAYLVSDNITMGEATRRLRLLRKAAGQNT